jgi:hypothetical protein
VTALVLCGPTRFHAIDEEATEAIAKPRVRELLGLLAPLDDLLMFERRPQPDLDAAFSRREKIRAELLDLGMPGPHWSFRRFSWIADRWKPGFAVPQCGMVDAGVAVTIREAEARGLQWSQECARRNGIVDSIGNANPLLVTRIVTATGRSRAFRHAVECEVCWNEGIGGCDIFPLIARGEIESDVDPRLEELIA